MLLHLPMQKNQNTDVINSPLCGFQFKTAIYGQELFTSNSCSSDSDTQEASTAAAAMSALRYRRWSKTLWFILTPISTLSIINYGPFPIKAVTVIMQGTDCIGRALHCTALLQVFCQVICIIDPTLMTPKSTNCKGQKGHAAHQQHCLCWLGAFCRWLKRVVAMPISWTELAWSAKTRKPPLHNQR